MTTEQEALSIQTEALRLADEIERVYRRGYETEDEATIRANNSRREAAAMLRKMVAEREEYRASMRRALEALEQATTGWNHEGGKWLHVSLDAFPVVDAAITDLRQRLEGTT